MREESESVGEPRTAAEKKPLVSVVVEGYNEIKLATSVTDVLEGLARQDYPLERIELILVGNEAQYRDWTGMAVHRWPFRRVKVVEAEGALYYDLKNRGAQQAAGEIIAFIDSDVYPDAGWVPSIVHAIEDGADATAGISTFWDRSRVAMPRVVLQAAASISFGHVVGVAEGADGAAANGVVAHNLAFRADFFRVHPFSTELGRNCGIELMRSTLAQSGARLRLVRGQLVNHSFAIGWFFYPFHLRVGWEEYKLRRITSAVPNRWMMHTGPLEPLITMLAYVAFDARSWFRYGPQIGLSRSQCCLRLPVLLALSTAARAVGAVGMYGGMLRPKWMLAWAEAQ